MKRQEPAVRRDFGRRGLFALPGLLLAVRDATVRLGLVQFGTLQWVAETIRHRNLAARHGVSLVPRIMASTESARVALLAGEADIVASDWPFAAAQRAAGTKLCFAPFTTALGGVMVPAGSPVHGLADLAGRRLGVAGGPLDKSWLMVQAAARGTAGIDLATTARIAYGAPPLLGAKLQQGELDAVLTFWTFAARLEASGFREAISVADCAALLGLPRSMSMVGFVFHEDWARGNRDAIDGFLAAVADAEQALARSDDAWAAIRPLMDAPDDALFRSLRRRFIAGIVPPSAAGQQEVAARVLQVLLKAGGTRATAGLTELPPGVFWDPTAAPA
jgi:NitT/TauT family transport system substrate-binding protein